MLLPCTKAYEVQVSRNARVYQITVKCVSFCGKQGLSFRGHRDGSTAIDASNMGNFIELVRFRAENDDVLHTYLKLHLGMLFTLQKYPK